jgi:hypothetical protein
MNSLVELFCDVDDFCQAFLPGWEGKQLASGLKQRRRGQLCLSEIMTIIIHFHQSNYRNFKAYYKDYVRIHLRSAFPGLVSYQRFVALTPRIDQIVITRSYMVYLPLVINSP